MGLLLGLGLGMVVALILERTDNSINNISDIKQRGVPILGIIPDIKKLNGGKFTKDKRVKKGSILPTRDLKRRIILREEPKSPISEAYRSLRTNLMYSAVEKSAKTILVTSPGPGEGKAESKICL